jgi:SAM-dependent methyltransferase
MNPLKTAADQSTADAFATSWNTLPAGSVYTRENVVDWLAPVTPDDIRGKRVLELGCGGGSLLFHIAAMHPEFLAGVDLGDSVVAAQRNMALQPATNYEIIRADLVSFQSDGFDFVYSIGVLHHLKNPHEGFRAVVRNTRAGGRFHCWVYGREGNGLIVYFVDPLRKLVSKLPWWFTKFGVALPLAVPFFVVGKLVSRLPERPFRKLVPLFDYFNWIGPREFRFFWHVAFDQLVTPQTAYLRRDEIERWLRDCPELDPKTAYVIARNGNSWKFGGRIRNSS